MRLLRPYIPLAVRIEVAERQYRVKMTEVGFTLTAEQLIVSLAVVASLKLRLATLLKMLFDDGDFQLDHEPALENREKIMRRGEIVGYRPDANDPAYLIYRTRHDHLIKTHVRGDHGQLSDTTLANKERRRKRKATRKHRYRWPKGRKLQSRNNLKAK